MKQLLFKLESCSEEYDLMSLEGAKRCEDGNIRISFCNFEEFMHFFKQCNNNIILLKPDDYRGDDSICEKTIRIYDSWNE